MSRSAVMVGGPQGMGGERCALDHRLPAAQLLGPSRCRCLRHGRRDGSFTGWELRRGTVLAAAR
ncbi:hypothetical protein, partial [Sphingobium phenoxybenzoativorans]|uniref:hypothetical protein n=1 Tax=Sphingobium phenoxybenzoativorans TaxID=1592790 RepID=UPI001C0CC33F